MKSEPIGKIRKRFKNEWLLIAVDKMDKARTLPLTGRLLAHSPHRDEIYEEMLHHKELTLVTHCEPGVLPPGFGAAF